MNQEVQQVPPHVASALNNAVIKELETQRDLANTRCAHLAGDAAGLKLQIEGMSRHINDLTATIEKMKKEKEESQVVNKDATPIGDSAPKVFEPVPAPAPAELPYGGTDD
jgi:chromosome segregation ATPase